MADRPRRVKLPALDAAPKGDAEESGAPPEALRAIAALLGRAATPKPKRSATPPRPRRGSSRPGSSRQLGTAAQVAPSNEVAGGSTSIGDREVPIQGSAVSADETVSDEIRRARKRMKRARRAVRDALERLIAASPEELSG